MQMLFSLVTSGNGEKADSKVVVDLTDMRVYFMNGHAEYRYIDLELQSLIGLDGLECFGPNGAVIDLQVLYVRAITNGDAERAAHFVFIMEMLDSFYGGLSQPQGKSE